VVFKERFHSLEYIRSSAEIAQKGLFVQLDAYRAHVFLDFRVIEDDQERNWLRVHDHLKGRGVHDIQRLRWELPHQPVLQPLREIFSPGYFTFLLKNLPQTAGGSLPDFLLNEAEHKLAALVKGALALLPEGREKISQDGDFMRSLQSLCNAAWIDQNLAMKKTRRPAGCWGGSAPGSRGNWLALWPDFLEGLRESVRMDSRRTFLYTAGGRLAFYAAAWRILRSWGISSLRRQAVQSVRLLLVAWLAGARGAASPDKFGGEL